MKEAPAVIDERLYEEPRDPCEPEKELLRCFLIRAIQDATGNVSVESQASSDGMEMDALEWIHTRGGYVSTHFRFDWVCGVLDLEPDAVRAVVATARHDGVKLSIFDTATIRVPKGSKFGVGRPRRKPTGIS